MLTARFRSIAICPFGSLKNCIESKRGVRFGSVFAVDTTDIGIASRRGGTEANSWVGTSLGGDGVDGVGERRRMGTSVRVEGIVDLNLYEGGDTASGSHDVRYMDAGAVVDTTIPDRSSIGERVFRNVDWNSSVCFSIGSYSHGNRNRNVGVSEAMNAVSIRNRGRGRIGGC
jgi:hypothetical protein